MSETTLQKRADGLFLLAVLVGSIAGGVWYLLPAASIPFIFVASAAIEDGAMFRLASLLEKRP
jgi:hypothetical protein